MTMDMDDIANDADVEAGPAEPGSFRFRIPQRAPVDLAGWRPDMGHFYKTVAVGMGSGHFSFLASDNA